MRTRAAAISTVVFARRAEDVHEDATSRPCNHPVGNAAGNGIVIAGSDVPRLTTNGKGAFALDDEAELLVRMGVLRHPSMGRELHA